MRVVCAVEMDPRVRVAMACPIPTVCSMPVVSAEVILRPASVAIWYRTQGSRLIFAVSAVATVLPALIARVTVVKRPFFDYHFH